MAAKKSTRADLLRVTAIHEAGHAAARLYVGASPTSVVIYGDGSGLTHGTGRPWADEEPGQYPVWDFILCALAGPYAEARIARRSRVFVLLTTGRVDYDRACEAVAWLRAHGFANTDEAAWARAERETAYFLRAHWSVITRIADELQSSGSLTVNAVRALWAQRARGPMQNSAERVAARGGVG